MNRHDWVCYISNTPHVFYNIKAEGPISIRAKPGKGQVIYLPFIIDNARVEVDSLI